MSARAKPTAKRAGRSTKKTAKPPSDLTSKPATSRPFEALAKKRAAPAKDSSKDKRNSAPPAPRPSPETERPRAARRREADDEVAFALHMQGVVPLARGAQRVPATASGLDRRQGADPSALTALDDAARRDLALLVSQNHRFEVVDDGSLLEGRRLDVDPRELRRLRKLQYAIDGKLDLHGHDIAGAKAAVERFVERRRSQGDRAIMIVHGRGTHSPRGVPVLRGELGAWLSQGRAAKDVLAFASFQDEDEGSGALMVLLAKR